MSENNLDSNKKTTGAAKLTAKQETLCQLIALEGLDQSEAYREAYDVSSDTLPATVWSEASRLVAKPKVAARIAELRAACQERAMVTADDVLQELKQIGFAAVKGDVRPADKIAALDKMSKILGLYRDDQGDRDQRPVVTQVTVVLNHGQGGTATETHPPLPPGTP